MAALAIYDEKTRARFAVKVGPPNGPHGCREWMAARQASGHGLFGVAGKSRRAHRVAWEMANGPVPSGLVIDHFTCDNPPCVETAHLKAVTPRANTLRSQTAPPAVNARKTECQQGHPFAGANLHVQRDGRRICRACKRAENTSDAARARKAAWWRSHHGKAAF